MPSTVASKSRSIQLSVTGLRDFPSGAAFIPAASLNHGLANLLGLPLHKHDLAGRSSWWEASLRPPRVLIADDHQTMLEAEIDLLSPYFDVVGTAADGAALVSEAYRLHPEVIVTDISMPILNGIDAVRKLRESGSTAKFVFVTVHTEKEFVEACMEAGPLGYVHKSSLKRHLVPAIKAVLAGQSYIS